MDDMEMLNKCHSLATDLRRIGQIAAEMGHTDTLGYEQAREMILEIVAPLERPAVPETAMSEAYCTRDNFYGFNLSVGDISLNLNKRADGGVDISIVNPSSGLQSVHVPRKWAEPIATWLLCDALAPTTSGEEGGR